MGKETTTNTYEGHVFYFTEPGDKNKELARFTMDKNVVGMLMCMMLYFSWFVVQLPTCASTCECLLSLLMFMTRLLPGFVCLDSINCSVL